MGFRDSDRKEYIRQPHIIVLIVIVVLIVFGAVFTAVNRLSSNSRRANMESSDACKELVKNENLCKFATSHEATSTGGYVVSSTTTSQDSSEVTTVEIENPNRMKSVTLSGLEEVESFVIIDSVTYYKDYEDGIWAKYEDSAPQTSENAVTYDFTNENSADVIEFRDNYKFESMEPCGDNNCFKYRVNDKNNPEAETYIWFDDKEYKLRRNLQITDETTTNTQIEYRSVTVQAPSPTKDITEEDLSNFE